jgi:hypothetical protein
VLRFWDTQVLSDLEGVLETIRNFLLTPHPNRSAELTTKPSPPRGEGEIIFDNTILDERRRR